MRSSFVTGVLRCALSLFVFRALRQRDMRDPLSLPQLRGEEGRERERKMDRERERRRERESVWRAHVEE